MDAGDRDGLICGVDEAGRGPLAGPVFAAAVILDPRRVIRGLDDSKKLPEAVRLKLEARIRERALAWCIAQASVEEIDSLNILQATLLAMARAVAGLGLRPSRILVDGVHVPRIDIPCQAVVQGDATVKAISAASILAKTARDAHMAELDALYPLYGLKQHKGYGTPAHLEALQRHGPCAVHRRSFAPVRTQWRQSELDLD